MELKFRAIDRSLLKMLFVRGLAYEISGIVKRGSVERRWEIICHRRTSFSDDVSFTAGVYGMYAHIRGEDLDKVLDELEVLIERAVD